MRVQWILDISKDQEFDELVFWSEINIIPRTGDIVNALEVIGSENLTHINISDHGNEFQIEFMRVNSVQLRKDKSGFYYSIWLK